MSDLNGNFKIAVYYPTDTLEIRLLGYKPLKQLISYPQDTQKTFFLIPEPLTLQTVVITPSLSPIVRLIKRIQTEGKQHSIAALKQYQFTTYNQVWVTFADTSEIRDSAAKAFLQKSYLFFWESVTRSTFFRGEYKEEVIASKASGIPKALPFSPTALQSISPYKNQFQILDQFWINPVSEKGLQHYRYYFTDTLYLSSKDTLYTLFFEPKRPDPKRLQGSFTVHCPPCAIKSLSAETRYKDPESGIQSIEILQLHEKQGEYWFPMQWRMRLHYKSEESDFPALAFEIESHVREVHTEGIAPPKQIATIEILPQATEKDSTFWNQLRPTPLDEKAQNTYVALDTLLKKSKFFQFWLNQSAHLKYGFLRAGIFYIDLLSLYRYNLVEGHRVGIGLWTNEQLTPYASLGASVAYGFSDQRMKYQGSLFIHPFRDRRWQLQGIYRYELIESGALSTIVRNQMLLHWSLRRPVFNVRDFFLRQMDYLTQWEVAFFAPLFKAQLQGYYQQNWVEPADSYRFQQRHQYQQTWVGARLRWTPKEVLLQEGWQLYSYGSAFPTLLWHGFVDPTDYKRWGTTLQWRWQYKTPFSWWQLFIVGGILSETLPYTWLHVFPANGPPNWFTALFAFETMPWNQYVANRFVRFHLRWEWLNGKFPSIRYAPNLVFYSNIAWGTLEQTQLHENRSTRSLEQGYVEIGIGITDLFPPEIKRRLSSLASLEVNAFIALDTKAPYYRLPILVKVNF